MLRVTGGALSDGCCHICLLRDFQHGGCRSESLYMTYVMKCVKHMVLWNAGVIKIAAGLR